MKRSAAHQLIWALIWTSLAPAQDARPAQEAPKAEPEAASPVPASEAPLTGWIDIGYRWYSDVGGSFDTYRSIVNLGEGPKFIGSEFTWTNPARRWMERLHVRAANWGGDPYGTLHVDAYKSHAYDFRGDYRDFAYFNFLPSFADPLLSRGITLNEQSFDTRRHLSDLSLDLLPGNWFIPYLGFERNSSFGTGATVFVSDANDYPVPTRLRDSTNLYRGGVRFEFRRMHVTLEEGGTSFKDDQSLFSSANVGNVRTPVLGRTLSLNELVAAYGIRGTGTYSKGLFTANPVSWLDLYGQFLFSQPETDVHYQHDATGSLYLQPDLLFYSGQQYLVTSSAKLPHTNASAGAEIRPLRRVRVIQSWVTDRLHNGGSANTQLTVAPTGTAAQSTTLLASSLATDYSLEEVNVLFDATRKLTLRGGYRYVWGDATSATFPADDLSNANRGKLRRHTGLGAVIFRPSSKLTLTAEAEAATSDGVYFRTSLYDYQKVRAQAHYQVTGSLNISGDFISLSNQNPSPGIRYDYLVLQESLSLFWAPRGGKLWDVQGSYARSTVRSDMDYLTPQDLSPQVSRYRENAHTATVLVSVHAQIRGQAATLSLGGSLYRSAGFLSATSRPTDYYQPVANLRVPLSRNVQCFAEWRYYGYGQAFQVYEGFRSHLLTTGLRFTR